MTAARKMLTYLHENPHPETLIGAARQLVFVKGTNSHDYKFSSAVLEDYYHVSPPWRDRYLAASSFNLCGSGAAGQRSGETNASGPPGIDAVKLRSAALYVADSCLFINVIQRNRAEGSPPRLRWGRRWAGGRRSHASAGVVRQVATNAIRASP